VKNGINALFFGSNFIYRKVRFEPSFNGDNRLLINYRSTADPMMAKDPNDVTVNWASYPADDPSSNFSGSGYGGAAGVGNLTVVGATTWFWQGADVTEGQVLSGALGGEFNNYSRGVANPPGVQLFGHSRVYGGVSDITYVTQKGEGGVFCTGTGQWIFHLGATPIRQSASLAKPPATTSNALVAATKNLLTAFGSGPASVSQPAVSNTDIYYSA
jgi:hypothetical protein